MPSASASAFMEIEAVPDSLNSSIAFCQGVTKTLTTSGTANRFVWSTGDTTATITVTPFVTTTYWVRGQVDTIPCYTFDTVVLTVIPLPYNN